MATVADEYRGFDLDEQRARIDQMRAETQKNFFEIQKLIEETVKANADAAKVKVGIKLAPWAVVFTGLGAGAALLAAGGALPKLF